MSLNTGVLVLLVLAVVGWFVRNWATNKRPHGTKALPGPRGVPFLGNLPQIPPFHSWLKFKEWGDRYGDIYQINIAGRINAVISSEKVANDLLRERGGNYSSREQTLMAAGLLSDNLRPVLLPYGEDWRRGRKLMHALANATVAPRYEPTQLLESSRLLVDLVKDPGGYEKWFQRYAGGVILRLAYGKVVETGEEEYIKRIMMVNHHLERIASPGSYLVDTFPVLMWLPRWLAPFKREGEMLHKEELDLFAGLIDGVRKQDEKGEAPDCFTKTWLEKEETYGLSNDQAAYVIGTMFEAGAGTTSAAMASFVLAMVHHPDSLRRMQAEIDRVVGDERLPTFDDIPQLPTVRAVAKETMRWRPVTSGGLPHQSIKDDVYDGFFIPAGTTMHANQWAIHRDTTLYPDPEKFLPNRWLEKDWPTYKEPLTEFPNLQGFSSFGFGRRACPGQNIAERNLNILISRIGWACDIRRIEGVDVPLYDYTTGFNSQPKPFKFDLKARSSKREQLIQDEYEREKRKDPLRTTNHE